MANKDSKIACLQENEKLTQEVMQKLIPWFPTIDTAFVIHNVGNAQDPLCNLLYLCLDDSLPFHVVAKPIATDGYIARPMLLVRSRYRFSEGTEAMHTLGLKDEVVQAIKQRNGSQTKLDA